MAVQLWERIQTDIPSLSQQIEQGQFGALLGWLREKIHRHGHKYEPQDLMKRVTGATITSEPYIRYLCNKYGEIYDL